VWRRWEEEERSERIENVSLDELATMVFNWLSKHYPEKTYHLSTRPPTMLSWSAIKGPRFA
jgi:hypothetical protein